MTPGFQNLHPDGLLVRTRDGRNFKAQEYLEFITPAGETFRIVIGATSDGASTPPLIWEKFGAQWLPPFGAYWLDAYLHDGAYQNWLEKLQPDGTWAKADLTQEQADALILQAMELSNVPESQRKEIYDGLRLFGWKAFRDDRKIEHNPT